MSTFVLVHGAGHSGTAWKAVADRLKERGHEAFAPTLAGHGAGADARVTHAESTCSLISFIVDRGLFDFVLVGHSYAGSIISKAVEVIPHRVRRLVFLSAFVLRDGESILETYPPAVRNMLHELAAASPDGTLSLPYQVWREFFMNDADEELARYTFRQLSPQPFGQLTEPISLKSFYALTTPRSYVVGAAEAMPGDPTWHKRMADRLGSHRFVQTVGGHEALFTTPTTLADSLIVAGADD